jgi:putative transposase
MPNYRRLFISGGTFFFTVNLLDRRTRLLTENIDALRAAYGLVARDHPFETVATCVLPEHLQLIWRLPPEDHDYSLRFRLIKSRFSKSLPRTRDPRDGRRTGERGIWQRRFWEHMIRDAEDLDRHVDDIHGNPLKHGLVAVRQDWPYSTCHEWKGYSADRSMFRPRTESRRSRASACGGQRSAQPALSAAARARVSPRETDLRFGCGLR